MADSDESILGVSFLAGSLILFSLFITWYRSRDPLLNSIPAIGFSDPILSYISAFYINVLDSAPMLKEGYKKTKPGLFRVPTFRRWMVLPTSVGLIEDVRKAPDDVLSAHKPFREITQLDYSLRFLNSNDHYHVAVIRSRLTRNIAATFSQAHEELEAALREFIPLSNKEWVKVSILPTVQNIVSRTSNRILVGTPLCENRNYQQLVLDFRRDVVKVAVILNMCPKPLKPIVVRMIADLPSKIRQMVEFIRPLVEERLIKMEEFGESWDDAPNDMLMWLMYEAKGVEKSPEGLARRLLMINLAAIHSTSITATQVLYRLLSHPEYIEPLRQEVEAAVAEEGWTKAGMDKMRKIDSFLRETQRIDPDGLVMSIRLTLRPFTFSNGATIPANTLVALPLNAIDTNEEIYPNPDEFDGFRFSKLCDKDGDAMANRHQATATSSDHLTFGVGRHACPGRFFAVNEIKAFIAHIVVTYDFKFDEGKGAPGRRHLGLVRTPKDADVLFRKRMNQR